MRATLYLAIAGRLLALTGWFLDRADCLVPPDESDEPADPEIEIPVLGAPAGTVSRIRQSDLDRALAWQRAEAERESVVLFIADGEKPWGWRTVQ